LTCINALPRFGGPSGVAVAGRECLWRVIPC
jgi:hypothetical protein